MLYIKSLEQAVPVFKALGSDIRIRLIQTLLEHQEMNMNELATASRYQLPLIEIIVDNHVLGMVRQWQTLFYGKRYSQTVFDDKIDYCKVAEGLGCTAIKITRKEEAGPAIQKALSINGPVVLDCMIEADDKVFPMVPAGAPISDAFDAKDLAAKENK